MTFITSDALGASKRCKKKNKQKKNRFIKRVGNPSRPCLSSQFLRQTMDAASEGAAYVLHHKRRSSSEFSELEEIPIRVTAVKLGN